MKIIEEVKEITAAAVAKKQDAAKLNYPKLIEQIKRSAALGQSECHIDESQMNQYDRELLQKEGFTVSLIDRLNKDKYEDFMKLSGHFIPGKEWVIKW